MKVIFLDIDGVLNNGEDVCKTEKINGVVGVNKSNLKQLKKLVSLTDAKIVLTSTWKADYKEQDDFGIYLKNKLESNGLSVFSCTEDKIYNRGKGIVDYLSHHFEITNFVIIDDDMFDDYSSLGLLDCLVKTDYCDGLTKEKVKQAVNILGKKSK